MARKCVEFKTVFSPALGHDVKRCARFSGTGRCVKMQKVFSPALGHEVDRCADFEGSGAGA